MEVSIRENTAGEELFKTPERRSVEALLDISEENFLKELEPHEYHCYSGWEEAVCGWARVAPLSGILVTQRTYMKSKQKEVESLSPFEATPSNADNITSPVDQSCGSYVAQHNLKKSTSSQQTGFWRQTTGQKPDVTEQPILTAIQRNTAHLSLEEKLEKMEETLRGTAMQPCYVSSKYCVTENRAAKPQKSSPQSSTNTAVSVKNLTFLPPIKSPHLNPKDGAQLCRGKKAQKGEVKCFMLDTKSGTDTGKRVDALTNSDLHFFSPPLTSKYQSCQLNPHMSAVSVSVPRRYQTPMSPKADIVHQNGYLMGKGFSQAIAQAHLHPSCLFS